MFILAMFPNLAHQVDHIYWMGNVREGFTISAVGASTGRIVVPDSMVSPVASRFPWDISQLYIRNGKIVEEWTLFNEFAVLQQVLAE